MSEPTLSPYDVKNKVFCFSEEGAEAVRRESARDGLFDLYRVRSHPEGAGLSATDPTGQEHVLYGPANGAAVLLREPGDTDGTFERTVDLWRSAGLDVPAALSTAELDDADTPRRVTESLVRQLQKELSAVSSNAVRLDRQIAVLREDLEDYRRNVEELQLTRRLAGEFPVLSFERKPTRSSLRTGGETASQLLPYTGNVMSAIAINLSDVRPGDGLLVLWLTAREDDSTLAEWELDASSLKNGWNAVSIARRIPTKYRFVDLHVRWKGFDGQAPRVHLSDAYGDADGFARTSTAPVQNRMLAMRVWTGNRFDDAVASEYVHDPIDRDRLTAPAHYQNVPEGVLKSVEGLTDKGADRQWLRVSKNGVLVHPTSDGPSIAALNVALSDALTGLALSACVDNEKSRPVSFRVVVLDQESDVFRKYVQDPDLQGHETLYEGDWEEVLPCTELPLVCEFSTSVERAKVLLMTKVADGNDAFAHAWFRNIRVSS